MRIEWAVYGEQNKGHALLAASDSGQIVALLTPHTDRPGDPPHGRPWGPIDSGFLFRDHYVLMRTFPDLDAGRAGMVRTYAAFVPITQLRNIRNLLPIFSRFPTKVEATPARLSPIEVLDQELANVPPVTAQLVPLAMHLGATGNVTPAVWALADPYLPTVAALWARLPIFFRSTFGFFFQFTPEHSIPSAVQVVATLPELANRWHPNQLLRLEAAVPSKLNVVQRWLSGATDTSMFEQILGEYEIGFTEFQKLNLLAEFAELISMVEKLDFVQVRRAAVMLGAFSKPTGASAGKRAVLFTRFAKLISEASVNDLFKVRNIDAAALPDLVSLLQPKIRQRLKLLAQSKDPVAPLIELLENAVGSKDEWWAVPMLQWLDKDFARLQGPAVRLAMPGLMSPLLGPRLADAIPDSIEAESLLILEVPDRPTAAQSSAILALAESRKWWRLHAAALAASMDAEMAVLAHIQKAGGNTEGLIKFAEILGATVVARVACEHDIAVLTRFIGGLLARDQVQIPVRCTGRFRLLSAALQPADTSISEKLRVALIAALRHFPIDNLEFSEFCQRCVTKDPTLFAPLSDLENLCEALPAASGKVVEDNLARHIERQLASARAIGFADQDFVARIVPVERVLAILAKASTALCVAAGLRAFEDLPFLEDDECRTWLVDYFTRTVDQSVPADECTKLAELLLQRTFPETAKMIRETVENYGRTDVAPLENKIRYKYQMLRTYQRDATAKRLRLPRVVIATALPLERDEVIKVLGRTEYDEDLEADVAIWPPDHPIFEVCVCVTGQGNISAMEICQRLMQRRPRPMFAFFLGVGGGLKDYRIGDVVYSTKVYYYESGKEVESGVKARPEVVETPYAIVQLAIRVEDNWQPTDQEQRPKAGPAVIASGEIVLTAKTPGAANYQLIIDAYNDSQAVDKEAYGFLRAAATNDVKYRMVIRGISDLVAGKAELDAKGNQPRAARNAAAFLFALLRMADQLVPRKRIKKKFLGITYAEEERREVE